MTAHVLLGIFATILPQIVLGEILVALFIYLYKYNLKHRNWIWTLIFISYFTGIEMFYRATGVSFLPYELSKYLQIGLVLFNLFSSKTRFKTFVGIAIIILILPSAILYPAAEYKDFIFTSLGIVALGMLVSFSGLQKISPDKFISILKAFLLPCISFVTFITIKTPALSDVEFNLSANFEMTGGFGSNQVATILSAAICVLLVLLDSRKFIGSRTITLGLIIYFFLRAFLSFSRGGIIGLVISTLLAYILFKKIRRSTLVKFGTVMLLSVTVFVLSNLLTGGMLLLRYQGDTNATLAGKRDKNLELITSGRTDYAIVDLALWGNNPVFGVGPGNSKFMRFRYGRFDAGAAHSEATRLLAENGIFGLIINLILIIWPIYIVYKSRGSQSRFIKTMLFAFAYATTYHSAMRTGITPLFYALASLDIIYPMGAVESDGFKAGNTLYQRVRQFPQKNLDEKTN